MLYKDDELKNDKDDHSKQEEKPNASHVKKQSGSSDTKTNIPGPNKLPDQQKVGEDTDDEKYHVET